jgi:hypothetical protein
VHQDARSIASAAAIDAHAFALGSDIELGGRAQASDLRVMAHEVAHVVQQRHEGPRVQLWSMSATARHERDAQQAADAVVGGRPFTVGQPKVPKPNDALFSSGPPILKIKPEAVFKRHGNRSRTKIGVGESVIFTAMAGTAEVAGDWRASGGKPTVGASGATFSWTAPSRSATVTIDLTTVDSRATTTMKVIEPAHIVVERDGPDDKFPDGMQGVAMWLRFVLYPMDVCFGNLSSREVGGYPSLLSGTFWDEAKQDDEHLRKYVHDPSDEKGKEVKWSRFDEDNRDTHKDHAGFWSYPSRYWREKGASLVYEIPNEFRVEDGVDVGKPFTKVTMVCTLEGPPNAGRSTVCKGEQSSAPRSPWPALPSSSGTGKPVR